MSLILPKIGDGRTIIIPGKGYTPGTVVYTGGAGPYDGGNGTSWGGNSSSQRCEWPYVRKAIPYTKITTVPGSPGSPGQPYIAPTPAQIEYNDNVGWGNSCSSSVNQVGIGQQLRFSVSHDLRGLFVGLATQGKELQYIGLYPVGLRFAQDGVEIFESGVVIQKIKASLQPDDEFIIRRYTDGSVHYQVNDTDAIKSESTLSVLKSYFAYGVGYQAETLILEATIESFVKFIYLEEPIVFRQEFTGSVSTSGYVNFRQEFTGSVSGPPVNFRQEFTGSVENGGNIGDLDLKVFATRLHAVQGEGVNSLALNIAPAALSADNDYIPPRLTELDLFIGPLIKSTEGVRVHTGELNIDTTVLRLHAADDDFAALNMDIAATELDAGQTPAGYMPLYNDLNAEEAYGLLKDVIIPLYMGLKSADTVQLFKDVLFVMSESLISADSQQLYADKEIAINEICSTLDSVRFSVDELPDHAGGIAWVMNVDTGATSLFLDYGFNSFMELNGITYGVSSGSIAKLQETEAPVPSSGIDYGLSNFGSPGKKRIPHFYAAVASSGKVFLRLLVDGYKAEYFALTFTDYVEPNKINIGRGFNAVYWNPMIIAPEGVAIEELDSLEWQPMVFPRRV